MLLKVSCTIADLTKSPDIQAKHVSEAIQPVLSEVEGYRNFDRQFWI